MIWSFLKGLMVGLPFVFVLGPALFSILQTSISKGFFSGLQMAMGIAISDVLIMVLCYVSASAVTENPAFQIVLGMVGSLFMVVYGLYLFFQQAHSKDRSKKATEIKVNIKWMGVLNEIGKGFVMNCLNPFLWVLWFSIISSGTAANTKAESICFIMGIETMIFSTDILKSYFANKITTSLSASTVQKINRIAGILLMACAIILLIRTLIAYDLIPLFSISNK